MSLSERLRTPGVKAFGIGILALLMLVPLLQVNMLIGERQGLQTQAQQRIATGIGGAQRIAGPVLSIPAQTIATVEDPLTHKPRVQVAAAQPLRILPTKLDIDVALTMELRHKGIYSLPTYVANLHIRGTFDRAAIIAYLNRPAVENEAHELRKDTPGDSELLLPLGELKSLRSAKRLELAGVTLQPRAGAIGGYQALSLPVDLTTLLAQDKQGDLDFAFDVEVSGSEAISFVPLAGVTTVSVQSSWPHPDYQGQFLPVQKEAFGGNGFKARWSVLQVNRALSASWYGDTQGAQQFDAAAFGVRLMQPSTVYSVNERALRYGVLFIVITFIGFFGWEHVSTKLRLHAMNYLLIGLALAVFYLLLLALSEHIGFALAYLVAALALIALIFVYVVGVTGNRLAAAINAALLGIGYALLYVILQSEDYALLLGSLLVFGALSALMIATRRLDWSKL